MVRDTVCAGPPPVLPEIGDWFDKGILPQRGSPRSVSWGL